MDSPTPTLPLPQGPFAAIFRACMATLQADPALQAVVPAAGWRSWTGRPGDRAPLPPGLKVCVRVSPVNGSDAWGDPSSFYEDVQLNVDMQVQTACIDDVLNLWAAIRRAFYRDDSARQRLVAAGATTGQPTFRGPAVAFDDGDAAALKFLARGVIRVEGRSPID